jgi:hypothetical protein
MKTNKAKINGVGICFKMKQTKNGGLLYWPVDSYHEKPKKMRMCWN